MRLWHEGLLPEIPRQQLLGQHRECCALRGKGWGKKHATINYVFDYTPYKLYVYHMKVMNEMQRRGYHHDQRWEDPYYRGKFCPPHTSESVGYTKDEAGYPEHNNAYLQQCLKNLREKGVNI
ncbi:hypothetical protein GCM10007063_23030 [Lentibacillus kapialis]|uniref:Pyrimidine dimer DNA glycosylase n=1 Tax=Lentibacillus kapialis TaxID=340214 RepID=A0A917UYR1_9BACI|nr:TIGR02328 family protein [Lentibacillus kapialis]GGK00022.1 hypothetical protein GCM10007063_23030 [Lentibacillus kapialis]